MRQCNGCHYLVFTEVRGMWVNVCHNMDTCPYDNPFIPQVVDPPVEDPDPPVEVPDPSVAVVPQDQ